jgi:hypothetical protein
MRDVYWTGYTTAGEGTYTVFSLSDALADILRLSTAAAIAA